MNRPRTLELLLQVHRFGRQLRILQKFDFGPSNSQNHDYCHNYRKTTHSYRQFLVSMKSGKVNHLYQAIPYDIAAQKHYLHCSLLLRKHGS